MSSAAVRAPLPEIFRRVEHLPSLPTVAMQIVDVCGDPDANLHHLSRVIASDPVLAARILRLANSPLYRRGQEITTLSKATAVLGLKTVKLMALSFSLSAALPRHGNASSFSYEGYWRHSLSAAVSSRSISRLLNRKWEGEAFLCGLLGRIGQLMMAELLPAEYAVVLERSPSILPAADLETEVLGYNFHDAGGTLLSSWKLPRLFCEVTAHWSDPTELPAELSDARSLCDILKLGDMIATVICEEDKGWTLKAVYEHAIERFGVAEEEINLLIVGLKSEIATAAAEFNVDMSSIGDHNAILEKARMQLVELSLGTAMDLQETSAKNEELERQKEELLIRAHTDPLTQLPNRGYFDQVIQQIIEARLQGQSQAALGLLIIDVDHFKSINDTHGHLVGDAILRDVAIWLQRSTRQSDIVARIGGEEFVAVLPNIALCDLGTVAERIRKFIDSQTVSWEGNSYQITASVGGALVQPVTSSDDAHRLMKLADSCLYEAKRAGRNQCVCRQLE